MITRTNNELTEQKKKLIKVAYGVYSLVMKFCSIGAEIHTKELAIVEDNILDVCSSIYGYEDGDEEYYVNGKQFYMDFQCKAYENLFKKNCFRRNACKLYF